jgi:hypothetical protein
MRQGKIIDLLGAVIPGSKGAMLSQAAGVEQYAQPLHPEVQKLCGQ